MGKVAAGHLSCNKQKAFPVLSLKKGGGGGATSQPPSKEGIWKLISAKKEN